MAAALEGEAIVGEKGNADVAALAADLSSAVGAGSILERTTVSATETVIGAGEDLAGTIREKSIGAVADETVAAARERMQRKQTPSHGPPSDETPPGG